MADDVIYDLGIAKPQEGPVIFTVPDMMVSGMEKLFQQVLTLLFADDGDLAAIAFGAANKAALDADMLSAEASRVSEIIKTTVTPDVEPEARLSELTLYLPDGLGSVIKVVVENETGDVEESAVNI